MIFIEFSKADTKNLSNMPGGSTTQFDQTKNAFSKPARNLPFQYKSKFAQGNSLFKTEWTPHKQKGTKFYGLGPTFTKSSCIGCHKRNGRSLPNNISDDEGFSLKINKGLENNLSYGDQIDTNSVKGVEIEAKIKVSYEITQGKYKDGTKYTLSKPRFNIMESSFGDIEGRVNGRIAPAIIGLGLISLIPEKIIYSYADEYDLNNDGISGRVNIVFDPVLKKNSIGRFGWKASTASLIHQTAKALHMDMGITSPFFLFNRCPEIQINCKKKQKNLVPEADLETIKLLSFYSGSIGVPSHRNENSKKIKKGFKLFFKAKCNKCHIPFMETNKNTNREFDFASNQKIQPFTDLLLHDMGKELQGITINGTASSTEWRTAPLWGLGLIPTVNGEFRLMHDGRARSIAEAIIWHGGEGKVSKNIFIKMSKEERNDLLYFLKSL